MQKGNPLEKLMKLLTIAGNAIMMNLMFLIACIPVVTIGQAWCGLLSAVRYNIRGDKWWDGFKAGFKTRFLRGTIAWIVMLVIDIYMLLELAHWVAKVGLDVPTVMSGIIFSLMIMITFGLQILNVYVPTDIFNWLRNAIRMVFKAPVEMFGSAVLFWGPMLMLQWWHSAFFYGIMVFVAAYFAVVATGSTMVLKNALIHYLLEARASGTLIADEGKKPEAEDADEEEDSEQ